MPLFDLPATKLSLTEQVGCRRCGDGINGRRTGIRPSRVVRGRQLPGVLKLDAAILMYLKRPGF